MQLTVLTSILSHLSRFSHPQSRNSVGAVICCVVWSIAEITRYLWYALNIFDKNSYLLTWCRYSFFIVLYPLGITGELLCIYKAVVFLQPLKTRAKYSFNLPNSLNVSFDLYYFLILAMLAYIPVFPQLYGHMLSQRRKILGGSKSEKKQE
jgi:very-long-chain (3R)-3-hydroxyacyl-CoA dehydratase